ncbi:hypothetical protein, partial [Escherichia coli]|uniref:hypothetical protein n=1 Tax=Escherichia coli TaxID=562 RepID=UPI0034E4582E
QLLLRQGRWPALLSLGLLLVALLLLGIEPGLAMIAAGLLLISVAVGIAQACQAWRVGLDASLLQLLRDEGLDGEAAARRTAQLRQYLLTTVQFALLVLAVLWPQT